LSDVKAQLDNLSARRNPVLRLYSLPPGEVITRGRRTKGVGHVSLDTLGQKRRCEFLTSDTILASIEVLGGTTHVDFGFAYDGHAIFVLHRFASCEWDAEMREHYTLRRRKEIIRDKSNGFDGGVSGNVMANSQGYCANLNPNHILIRTGCNTTQEKKVTSSGESGSRGCEGGTAVVLRPGVRCTRLAIEGAIASCTDTIGTISSSLGTREELTQFG
jgi:hypothetical protein